MQPVLGYSNLLYFPGSEFLLLGVSFHHKGNWGETQALDAEGCSILTICERTKPSWLSFPMRGIKMLYKMH